MITEVGGRDAAHKRGRGLPEEVKLILIPSVQAGRGGLRAGVVLDQVYLRPVLQCFLIVIHTSELPRHLTAVRLSSAIMQASFSRSSQ
jgi:hypothetical protein